MEDSASLANSAWMKAQRKGGIMKTRIAGQPGQEHPVRIEFHDEQARTVSIQGSINRWQAGAAPMVRATGGRWITIVFLPSGSCEYSFVVDGCPIPDAGIKCAVTRGTALRFFRGTNHPCHDSAASIEKNRRAEFPGCENRCVRALRISLCLH